MNAAPDATIVIVTKDRREELADALESASSQEGNVEILVVDDGSSDGTAAMVSDRFPHVRIHRFKANAGLVVRRNDAARLARGDVIVSIDDDAVFTSADTVIQTLRDFEDDPRIAAVGIPYRDVHSSPDIYQQPPDAEHCWIGPVYRGTAHAVRRDVFLRLGGYRERIVHQGEEHDFCLRLLDEGLFVRYGRASPIDHRESPRRSNRRQERYGRRNDQLLCATYYPHPWSVVYGVGYAAKAILRGIRSRKGLGWILEGIVRGAGAWATAGRRPVTRTTFARDQQLRRARCVRLDDLTDAALPSGLGLLPWRA